MLKQIYIYIIFVLSFVSVFAQRTISFTKDFDDFSLLPITIDGSTYYNIDMGEDMIAAGKIGRASLPKYNRIVELPNTPYSIHYTILEKDTIHIKDNIPIVPLQKSQIKTKEDTTFYFDKQYYVQDSFDLQDVVSLHRVGQMNEHNLAVLSISPLRYNPKQNLIERIKKIQINISFSSYEKLESATVYASNMLRPYKIVILSSRMFEQTLRPFVSWKIMQGYDITEVYTDEIGYTNTEIQAYLKKLYYSKTALNPAFDYLLIVGDTSVVPTNIGKYKIDNYPSHFTDLYYAEFTGDILPEVFFGRISATDTATLSAILQKTINYEKYAFEDDSFLQSTLLVAGRETSGNYPTYTNGQINYLKDYFKDLTDTLVYYNPSSSTTENVTKIKNNLSSGQAWIVYTGHCSEQGWYSPAIRINYVDSMYNYGKYGVMINNCCLSGKFDDNTCFTEKLLQQPNRGMVGVIGASDYTLWDEDYYWSVGAKNIALHPLYTFAHLGAYDRVMHTHDETRSYQYTTMGQIVQAGNLAVLQSLSDYTNVYFEMYNLQGDPTLVPYLGIGKTLTANYPNEILVGTQSLSFTTAPYTYVALSTNDTLFAAAEADSFGNVILDISNIVEPRKLTIVLSNQFYKTIIDTIEVIAKENPYITIKDIKFVDVVTGEICETLSEGEMYQVNFTLVNSGKEDFNAPNSSIEIFSDNNLISSNNVFYFSEIKKLSSQNISAACMISVDSGVKNLQICGIHFIISGTNAFSNTRTIHREIIAPEPQITSVDLQSLSDTLNLCVGITNVGRKTTANGIISITNLSEGFILNSTSQMIDTLPMQLTNHSIFSIYKQFDTLERLSFLVTYIADEYKAEKWYNISLDSQIETFEQGLSVFNWNNDTNYAWFIDSTHANSGLNSMRSYNNLPDEKKSSLKMNITNEVSSTLSFYYMVSSEKDYDKFICYVDGEPVLTKSGGYGNLYQPIGWTKFSFDLPGGEHEIVFSYEKDYSTKDGEDCAWIDDVCLVSGNDTLLFGLEDLREDNIVMYPNPTKNYVCLTNLTKDAEIFIFDNMGKKVYNCMAKNGNIRIDLRSFSSGNYVIAIEQNSKILMQKKLIIVK